MKKEKTGKNAPRQRAFDGRERVTANWQIFKDQSESLKELAKKLNSNVQASVRHILDEYFDLPKEEE